MEPLFDIERYYGYRPDYDSDLLEQVREEGWFPDEEEVEEDEVYEGQNVSWVGRPGRMLRVQWDEIQATQGNPFDADKVGTYAEIIRDGRYGFKALVGAPKAMVHSVGLDDVVESREAQQRDELFDSHGMTRPFTTGDEELDEYLTDPETFLERYAADEDDAAVIQADMTERAEEAVSDGDGDLGNVVAYLRDGNHRAFAAQLAGEPDVWVQVRWHTPAELHRAGLREEDLK
jgi:hypothetical protein